MIEDKSERTVPLESPMKDRPAGPHDRETESGLIYGRWYGGAAQDCGCAGVPEGIHVPGCKKGLCESKRAEPEIVESAAATQVEPHEEGANR